MPKQYRVVPNGDRFSVQYRFLGLFWVWMEKTSHYEPQGRMLFWTYDAARAWIKKQQTQGTSAQTPEQNVRASLEREFSQDPSFDRKARILAEQRKG